MWLVGMVFLIFAVDVALKDKIEKADAAEFPKELKGSKGRIMLYKNHNDGFPFGVLREKPELVRMFPLILTSAIGGIFAWLFTKKGYRAEKIGFAMILGGALSNLYDRWVRHYVVDYFSFQWKALKKVVFNLGDIFVFLGSGILLVLELLRNR